MEELIMKVKNIVSLVLGAIGGAIGISAIVKKDKLEQSIEPEPIDDAEDEEIEVDADVEDDSKDKK